MNETIQAYKVAIELCDNQRDKFELIKASPNQIVFYNIFTRAKTDLITQLAMIEDALGIYNLKDKNES